MGYRDGGYELRNDGIEVDRFRITRYHLVKREIVCRHSAVSAYNPRRLLAPAQYGRLVHDARVVRKKASSADGDFRQTVTNSDLIRTFGEL
jgi:hypothetical protein